MLIRIQILACSIREILFMQYATVFKNIPNNGNEIYEKNVKF
jgi:hypothetical protein